MCMLAVHSTCTRPRYNTSVQHIANARVSAAGVMAPMGIRRLEVVERGRCYPGGCRLPQFQTLLIKFTDFKMEKFYICTRHTALSSDGRG